MSARATVSAFILCTAIAVAATAQAGRKPDPAEVAAAERAFARDGYDTGIKASFLKHSAADAIVLSPGPVNAHESLKGGPDAKPDDPKLEWWPAYAGIARSGDLGFTTGPYAFAGKRRGHYFTVWARQPDGGWKWIFDGGAPANADAAPGPDSQTAFLKTATVGAGSPEKALAELKPLEAKLAEAAATDPAAAYRPVLAADSRLQGSPSPPATDAQAVARELAWRGPVTMKPLGGRASSAGDLAWTYGEAAWTRDGKPLKGYYVRIWQKRPAGWTLVFDELVRG